MANPEAEMDVVLSSKCKKEAKIQALINKNMTRAKKAKPNKQAYDYKPEFDRMNIKSLGNKASPVSSVEFAKIKNLNRGTLSDRVVSFAYPGPDNKTPFAIYTMRFIKDAAYSDFLRRVDAQIQEYPPGNGANLSTTSLSDDTYGPSAHQNPHTTTDHAQGTSKNKKKKQKKPKKKSGSPSNRDSRKTKKQTNRRRTSFSSRSSSSFTSSSSVLVHQPHQAIESYVSTERSCFRSHSLSPLMILRPAEPTYVNTMSRKSRQSSRARNRHPRSVSREITHPKINISFHNNRSCSSSSTGSISSKESLELRVMRRSKYAPSDSSSCSYSSCSSSTVDFAPRRSNVARHQKQKRYSSASSSSSSSDDDRGSKYISQPAGESQLGDRKFVISHCTGGRHSRMKCRPVAQISVAKNAPSFTYKR